MKTVNEQFAEMQKKTMESLEPMQNMSNVAAEAFERIARKNYDLMGDLVDYAVSQVKAPEGKTNIREVYEMRVAETKAFADKVNARAAEYVELAGELGELVSASATKAAKTENSSATKAAKTENTSAAKAAKTENTSATTAAKTEEKAPVAKKTASKKRAAKAT